MVELLQKPYMSTYSREEILESDALLWTIFDWDFVIDERDYDRGMKVWVPLAVDKPIPFGRRWTMFVKKAQAIP